MVKCYMVRGCYFGHSAIEMVTPPHRTLPFPFPSTEPITPYPPPQSPPAYWNPSIHHKVNKDPLFIDGHEGGGGRWIKTGRILRREREVVLVIQRVTGREEESSKKKHHRRDHTSDSEAERRKSKSKGSRGCKGHRYSNGTSETESENSEEPRKKSKSSRRKSHHHRDDESEEERSKRKLK